MAPPPRTPLTPGIGSLHALLYPFGVPSLRAPRALALASLLGLCGLAAPASADVSLWEEEVDAGETPERWVHLGGWIQPAYYHRQTDAAGQPDHGFSLQRARLYVEATPVSWLRMRLDVGFLESGESSYAVIRDAYAEAAPWEWLEVRAGRFRVPFLLTHGFDELALGLGDRPLYTPSEGPLGERGLSPLAARDLGVMVHGRIGDVDHGSLLPVVEYRLGVFAGEGATLRPNRDGAYLYSARLRVHAVGLPEGVDQENDLARNVVPRVTVGAGVFSNCDAARLWSRGFSVDLEARWQGFYFAGAFVWLRNGRASDGQFGYDSCAPTVDEFEDPSTAPLFLSSGARLQAQYALPDVLLPGTHEVELLTRMDWVNPWAPDDGSLLGAGSEDPRDETPGFDGFRNLPSRLRFTAGARWMPMGDPRIAVLVAYQRVRERETHFDAAGELVGQSANDLWWVQLTAGF